MPTDAGPTNLPLYEAMFFKKPIFYSDKMNNDQELKKMQESQETNQDNQPALVVVEHNQREQKAALSFMLEKYPDIRRSTSNYKAGHGHHEGQDAAQGVGLRKQTEGVTSPTRALTGS